MYGTEDLVVRSKMDNVARTIQMLPTVGQLSQLHNRRIASPQATGCGKKQEQVLITQSSTTLFACFS